MYMTAIFRTLTLLVAIATSLGLPLLSGWASPRLSVTVVGTQGTSSNILHVTLRTPEGLDRFVFAYRAGFSATEGERHYGGYSRLRNGETVKRPAALTLTSTSAWIYFTSRRTGRPVSATITLNERKSPRRLSVSRVPQTSLACGSHAGEDSPISSSSRTRRERTGSRTVSTRGDESPDPFSPLRVLEVATEADYEFYLIHGSKTNAFIRSILNATDVLYTSTLGITIKIVDQKLHTSGKDDSSSITALSLLEKFRTDGMVSSSRADVRHLFTVKPLDGFTIGIAYVSATCQVQGRYSAGLSRTVSTALHPYLAAHEIGHNLSAAHDNVPRSVMNPAITSANNQFAAKTKTDIHEFVRLAGGCLSPERVGDVRFVIDPTDPTQFSSTVTFLTPTELRCHVSLLGSPDNDRFINLATQKITSQGGAERTAVTFNAPLPPLEGTQKFTFHTRVTCGGTMKASKSASLKVGSASSNTVSSGNGARWLNQLRNNFR